MTHYLKQGALYSIAPTGALDIHNTLPPELFVLNMTMEGYKLAPIEPFKPLNKYYGNLLDKRDRILSTFESRPSGTGVLLEGDKGSGKTLLAQAVALECMRSGMPAILINNNFCGDGFNQLIKSIDQPAVILFDEFEKVYDEQSQQMLLTLLDGNYPSKKLFLLTINERTKVSNLMKNRPGRVFYRMQFRGLEQSFIIDYCKENLKNQDHLATMGKITHIINDINFDMLKAIVEEMNRYNESPQKTLEYLNVAPEYNPNSWNYYSVSLEVPEGEPGIFWLETDVFQGSPIATGDGFDISYYSTLVYGDDGELVEAPVETPVKAPTRLSQQIQRAHRVIDRVTQTKMKPKKRASPEDLEYHLCCTASFEADDLQDLDDNGSITYINDEGYKVVFTKNTRPNDQYYDLL